MHSKYPNIRYLTRGRPRLTSRVWIWLGIIACIALSALFSGLNLAIFSLSQLRLQIEADAGNRDAARVLDLRKNLQLYARYCIWATSALTYFLHCYATRFCSRTWCVLLLSRCDHSCSGEIAPQAASRNAL